MRIAGVSLIALAAAVVAACGPETTGTSAGVVRVVLASARDSIMVGDSVSVNAVPQDANGNSLEGFLVTWSTSDPTVAAVTNDGIVWGIGPGTAWIKAFSDGASDSTQVTVLAQPESGGH